MLWHSSRFSNGGLPTGLFPQRSYSLYRSLCRGNLQEGVNATSLVDLELTLVLLLLLLPRPACR
eukprot:8107717-Pyramimonas_sp.AAC.1